jgi:hypothetical protein
LAPLIPREKKNRTCAAKKLARKARLREAPAGNSASSQPQQGHPKGGPCLEQPGSDPAGRNIMEKSVMIEIPSYEKM